MGTLIENDRLAGPYLAEAGQVDFPADFPIVPESQILIHRYRGDDLEVLVGSARNMTDGSFTCRSPSPMQDGDRIYLVSDTRAARPRAHAPNGGVRSDTLEGDATALFAMLQEMKRDQSRSLMLPVGDVVRPLPSASGRADKILHFDSTGAPTASPVKVEQLALAIAQYSELASTALLPRLSVASAAHLAALPFAAAGGVFVESRSGDRGDGYAGVFEWVTGNQSANVATDTAQGIWVAPSATPNGSLGAWRRVFSGPADLRWFGAKGDGVNDDAVAIRASRLPGLIVGLYGLSFTIKTPIPTASNWHLQGPGKLKLASTFPAGVAIQLAGSGFSLRDFEVDGSAILDSGRVVSAIRTLSSTLNAVVEGLYVHDFTFDGINLAQNTHYTHTNPRIVGNRVERVGWTGIAIEACRQAGWIEHNHVVSTGYHAYATLMGCENVMVRGNYASKAVPPPVIYSGPGSVGGEGGFLFVRDPSSKRLTITSNVFEDNRNSNQDGIGLGENGTEHGSWVVSNNIVRHAGLFGIDPGSNCICTGNIIEECAQTGIFLGLDLAGVLRNVVVSGNVIQNAGTTAGQYGISIGANLHGNPFDIDNVTITGNVVVDTRETKLTAFGLGINTGANTTINGLRVKDNDFFNVGTQSILIYGGGIPLGSDYEASGNRTLGGDTRTVDLSMTTGSGTLATAACSAQWQRDGNRVHIRGQAQITDAGTAAGVLRVNLPINAKHTTPMTAMLGLPSEPLYGMAQSGHIAILKSGGTTAIASGASIFFSGSYEIATS